MKMLILACARSGTMFTARLLKSFGLDFTHESIGKSGGIGWMFVSDRCFVSGSKRFPMVKLQDFSIVLHQVRNPLDVVRSFPSKRHTFWKYVEEEIGELSHDELRKRLQIWLSWNLLCERKSHFTYCVESLPTVIGDKTNTREGKLNYLQRPTWQEVKDTLPAAFSLASKYGYV